MCFRIIAISTLLFLLTACEVRSSGSPPGQILLPDATWTRPPAPSPVLPTNMPAITGTQLPVSTNATATRALQFPSLQPGTATRTSMPSIPSLQPATRPAPSATLTPPVIIQPAPTRTLTPVPITTKFSYQSLLNLVGRIPYEDPEFVRFAGSNLSTCVLGMYFQYICQALGVEFARNSGGKVTSFWIYPQGADGNQEYKGELPLGLTWQDTRAVVERKMGPPSRTSVGLGRFEATYLAPKLVIGYQTPSTTNMSARLYYINYQSGLH